MSEGAGEVLSSAVAAPAGVSVPLLDVDEIHMPEEIKKTQKHWLDVLSHVFIYLAIASGSVAGVCAIVLYSLHDIQAVTASHGIAGLCAFSCVCLTGLQVAMHLTVYSNPNQQRYIVRIILMCPIYAVDSFIGLVAYQYAAVVNLVRDSYESYVIYTFFMLLLSYLGGEASILSNWEESQPSMRHPAPLCCLPRLSLGRRMLNWWKFFLLQYAILNPALTLIAIPLYFTGNWQEGALSPQSPYAWFSAVKFISVSLAFSSLVYFFFSTRAFYGDGVKPVPKFAAIKAVVFFSFWQSVLLAALNHFHEIPHSSNWTADEVATGLGNFILCIEMFLIAIAHRWIFSDAPYHTESGRQSLTAHHMRHVFAVGDVIREANTIVRDMRPISKERECGNQLVGIVEK